MLRLLLSPGLLAHQMIEGETALLWPHLHLTNQFRLNETLRTLGILKS